MDNAEEILQSLEEFSKLKPKEVPKELEDYLGYVAKTGDPVYQWHLVKCLFHEKLANVITEFYETSPSIDLPPCPNVDPFNYERLKTSLLERLDTFSSAPFTVQRICELLTTPKKQYNRVDKFMRAVEKNILVVSTREPGVGKRSEFDQTESVLNVNGVPDNKDHEITDAERVNVCSGNSTPKNSSCLSCSPPPIPVENAVNACVIQEEIEIANTANSTTIGDDKSWNDNSERQMVLDSFAGDSTVEKTEESSIGIISDNSSGDMSLVDVTKVDVTTTSNELDKASSLMFLESKEVKLVTKEISVAVADQNDTTEVTSTPDSPESSDSPESPEPIPEDVLCDASSDDSDASQEKQNVTEESGFQIEAEEDNLQCTEVVSENKGELEETVQPDTLSESSNVVIESFEEEQQPITNKESLSPCSTVPDSSNDCFAGEESVTETTEVNVLQPEENSTSEVVSVTSSQEQEQHEEIIESTSESAELVKPEEKLPDGISEAEAESSDLLEVPPEIGTESVCIEEVTDVKEVEEEDESRPSAEVVETCKVHEESSNEEERESGSVIHATPVTSVEQDAKTEKVDLAEAEVVAVTSTVATSQAIVEDICVDQSSCGSEEEAMDIDESSSHQMTTSESEMNEDGEPMDQSEQPQS